MSHNPKMITTIDSHTAGESTRLVTGGLPDIKGGTMVEKMAFCHDHLAWLPAFILLEPRGHKDLYGAILTEPCSPKANWGILFMNNHTYENMCGHGLIGVITCLLETGLHPIQGDETHLVMDTPAGLIQACARCQDGEVQEVTFTNVASFLYKSEVPIDLPEGERFTIDIAFGGNFFVLLHASQLGMALTPENAAPLTDLGMRILKAANQQVRVRHPENAHIDRMIDLRFYTEIAEGAANSRNMVILGNRMVDRSPCGTGTCAELALRFARGEIRLNQPYVCESILGTRFTGVVVGETSIGTPPEQRKGIIPQISGRAYLTGFHRFIVNSDDPLVSGFILA